MTLIKYIVIVLVFSAVSWGQDLRDGFTRHNLAKQDLRPNVKAKNMAWSLDEDTTSFKIHAWDDCSMEIKRRAGVKHDYKLYEMKDISDAPNGNLEWEVVLKSKPASNVFTWDVVTEGLRYSYQPILYSATDIELGVYRPDSAKGSYAVFRTDNKRGNITNTDGSQEDYITGKAFHIFRPEAYDSGVKTTWCLLNIENGIMTITVPQKFLDEATYPVFIDPQFGNTNIGASQGIWDTYRVGIYVTMAATSGQVLDSVVLRCWGNSGATEVDLYGGFYEDDGGPGPGALAEENATPISMDNTEAWYEIAMTSTYSLTASTDYWIAFHCTSYRIRHDVDAGETIEYVISSSFADPFGAASTIGYYMSAYGVYSAGAAPSASTRRRKIILRNSGS